MRNQNLLVFFTELTLFLFLIPLALAQAPIEGWDKAKLGMSPEELKDAYKEEEGYFEQRPHLGDFWTATKENRFGRTLLLFGWSGPLPYTLYTGELRVLGKEAGLYFRFVNTKLFEIEIKGRPIYEKAELEELKLKLKNALVAKYGKLIREEQLEEEKLLKWKDSNDNLLIFKIRLKPAKGGGSGMSGLLPSFPSYTVKYIDKELKEIWERKKKEWENERKSLEERGVKSF